MESARDDSINDTPQSGIVDANASEKETSTTHESDASKANKELKRKQRREQQEQYWKKRKVLDRERRKKKKEEGTYNYSGSYEAKKLAKQRKKLGENELEFAGSIVLDASFDDLMTDKEIRSLGSQINYTHAANMRAPKPFHIYLTSLHGKLEEQLNKHSGFKNWKIHKESKHFTDVFKKEDIVYLSSESDNVLQSLEPNKFYIVGALVDHNRLKGLSFSRAQELGIATAQLPIGNYLKVSGRKVLTVNQGNSSYGKCSQAVVEILLNYAGTNDWKLALEKAIPQRKQVKQSTPSNDNLENNTTNTNTDGVEQ